MSRKLLVHVWILFGILLANFAAQVVYFYFLYFVLHAGASPARSEKRLLMPFPPGRED